MRPLILALACSLAVGAGAPRAADLGAIDRTLGKEPAYRSGAPRYCLLVFGPKADTRVWLVLDLTAEPWEDKPEADLLYVDRDGDGDLTGPGERVTATTRKELAYLSFTPEPAARYVRRFVVGDIAARDGKARHSGLTVEVGGYVQDYRPCALSLKVAGLGEQSAGGSLLRFAERPEDAPVIHFNGPLRLRLHMHDGRLFVPISYEDDAVKRRKWYAEHPPRYEERPLVRGAPARLAGVIGTPGLGRGTFAVLSAGAPPAAVHPVAEVEFPPADPKASPLKTRVVLEDRCCGTQFCGTLHVPETAAVGKARVTLSFPDWRATPVGPGVGEVSVVAPDPSVPGDNPRK